jgi:hypothetical protein
VNGKFTFSRSQSAQRFINRTPNILCAHVTKQKEAGGIGMTSQIFIIVFACQHMDRSMFQGMIAPGCKISREFQNLHDFIIV